MTDEMEHRLQRLEAKVDALTQLTLSHIVASDIWLEGVADSTIRLAADQRETALEQGNHRLGMVLGDLLKALCDQRDLPPPF
jgi:hypothetical protein